MPCPYGSGEYSSGQGFRLRILVRDRAITKRVGGTPVDCVQGRPALRMAIAQVGDVEGWQVPRVALGNQETNYVDKFSASCGERHCFSALRRSGREPRLYFRRRSSNRAAISLRYDSGA
jgi:hypothetical protein